MKVKKKLPTDGRELEMFANRPIVFFEKLE